MDSRVIFMSSPQPQPFTHHHHQDLQQPPQSQQYFQDVVINGMITPSTAAPPLPHIAAQDFEFGVVQQQRPWSTSPRGSQGSEASILEEVRVVANRYHLVRKLGEGSFGELFQGVNVTTGENVAIKFEPLGGKHKTLDAENEILYGIQGGAGVPAWKYYGMEGNYRVLVMQLLGPNLHELYHFCRKNFSLKTILMLAIQLVSRLEHLHSRNIIHRDLKPENIVMGLEPDSEMVYIIDFGLSKRFRHPVTLEHIPEKVGKKGVVGTARYSSLKCHLGHETSRRDDLESLAYILIYFIRGSLPWQGIKAATRVQQVERIKQMKMSIPAQRLCLGCPEVFLTFLLYSRNLGFTESPDYSYLRQIFTRTMYQMGFECDNRFDWFNPSIMTYSDRINSAVRMATPTLPHGFTTTFDPSCPRGLVGITGNYTTRNMLNAGTNNYPQNAGGTGNNPHCCIYHQCETAEVGQARSDQGHVNVNVKVDNGHECSSDYPCINCPSSPSMLILQEAENASRILRAQEEQRQREVEVTFGSQGQGQGGRLGCLHQGPSNNNNGFFSGFCPHDVLSMC